MNELIKINDKGLVSAKELYFGLGLNKSQWSRWYTSNIIKNSFFKENVDWGINDIEIYGNKTKDFDISLEFALHIINSAKTVSSQRKYELIKELGLDNKVEIIGRKEIEFVLELKQALIPFGIEGLTQYSVFNYRIDFYIPELNIAIEYDEDDHKDYTCERHNGRQLEIEKELGCKFIRVSDKKSNAYNIGLIIREIFMEVA